MIKRLYILLALLPLISVLSGCYKDKTKIGDKDITIIEYVDGVDTETAYSLDKWQTLKIEPNYKMNIDKDIKFEWDIDGRIVSTEPVLEYTVDTLGQGLPCRLRMYTEDGSTFVRFTLNANSPYQGGVIILSNSPTKGELTFKRTDYGDDMAKANKAYIDCITSENPDVNIGMYGSFHLSVNTDWDDTFYLLSKSPDLFFAFDYNTLKINGNIEAKFTDIRSAFNADTDLIINSGDGTLNQYFLSDGNYFNFLWPAIEDLAQANTPFINEMMVNADDTYYLFDDANETLLECNTAEAKVVTDFDMAGMTPVSFATAGASGEVPLLLFKDNSNNLKLYNMSSKSIIDFSENSTIAANSVVVGLPNVEPNMLYSNGNMIYRMNYSTENFPTAPLITLADSDMEIRMMDFRSEGDSLRLYVLGYNPSSPSERKSTLYCYDYTTQELIWSEAEVAYEPIQMLFK